MSEELNLAEIEARVKASFVGPWQRVYGGGGLYDVMAKSGGATVVSQLHICDAEFIAHARQDIPALIDEIERLRAALGSRGVPLGTFAEQVAETVRLLSPRETPDYITRQFFTNCPDVDAYAKQHGWPATLEQIAAALRGMGTPPCQTCQGRGWVMKSEVHYTAPGFGSGGMWNEPCPDCASNQCQKPAVGVGTPQEKEPVNETLAERNYVWVLEHQILPNVYGLKYVALLKAINVLKSQQVPVGTPHQEEKAAPK